MCELRFERFAKPLPQFSAGQCQRSPASVWQRTTPGPDKGAEGLSVRERAIERGPCAAGVSMIDRVAWTTGAGDRGQGIGQRARPRIHNG